MPPRDVRPGRTSRGWATLALAGLAVLALVSAVAGQQEQARASSPDDGIMLAGEHLLPRWPSVPTNWKVPKLPGETSSSAASATSSSGPSTTVEQTSSTARSSSSTPRSTTTRPRTTTRSAPSNGVAATGDNPLFKDTVNGLANSPCALPRWGEDQPAAERFFRAGLVCLNQKWSGTLARAGLPFRAPKLEVPQNSRNAVSPCTSSGGSFAAFYCSMNETIYMPMNTVLINSRGKSYVVFLNVLAHEYGHHVQALSGISDASWEQRKAAGVRTPKGLELSRRQELQANCFGGMFLGNSEASGTWTPNVSRLAIQDDYRRGDGPGDSRTHGTQAHSGSWTEHGYKTNRNFQCNTWKAPADSVT